MKKPSLWDLGVATGKNLIEKKMTQSVRQWYDLWRVKKFHIYLAVECVVPNWFLQNFTYTVV